MTGTFAFIFFQNSNCHKAEVQPKIENYGDNNDRD